MSNIRLLLLGTVLLWCYLRPSSGKVAPSTGGTVSILNKLTEGETLTVRLKSVSTGEYLYAADSSPNSDDLRRCVFTWRDKSEPLGIWADWTISGVFTEGTLHVRLASRRYGNEILFVPTESEFLFDPERRNTYTWRSNETLTDDTSADWFMETDVTNTAKHPNRYTLLNVLHREYLYAVTDDKSRDLYRRRVFTWVGVKRDFINRKQHMWDMEIVTDAPSGKP